MSDRTIPCPECRGTGLKPGYVGVGCGTCLHVGTIPDRRSPTAAERAVERIKGWCEMAHNPEAPQTLVYAEKYVCDHILSIIREEDGDE